MQDQSGAEGAAMSATVISAAHEFVDQVRATFEAEVQVAYDALLQAGWPSTRIAQAIERIAGGGLRCTLSLTRGIEVPDDLPVFVAEWRFTGGVVAGSERRIQITGVWLVDPIPTPHASTIRAANPPPRPTRCTYCDNEISDESCWCGEGLDHDAWSSGHAPVPMGCTCSLGTP